ncbi:MAG: hypothetical protein A4E65_02942 [Syntrophorhabdus sp. PtaU1.Bin153]|nr:MAG: hypothetical protein A4E65_02942 [Syntrophorhabdus sp. PtaU1.Bin153]
MPVLYKYKDKNGFYILTSIAGKVVTFQLNNDGYKKLDEAGIRTGKRFHRSLLFDLYRSGEAYTQNTGTGDDLFTHPVQLELDFSDDPEPETLFPSCSICESQDDLHLVELIEKEPSLNILCSTCRQKKQSFIDTSIPLPFVTRTLLKRFLDIKGISKVDKSVSAYQELLSLEFSEKWKTLAEKKGRKPVQETLISPEDSGTLI